MSHEVGNRAGSGKSGPVLPRGLIAMMAVTGLVLLGSLAIMVTQRKGAPAQQATQGSASKPAAGALQPDPGLEGLAVPEFSLVDQDGRPVDHSIFDGRVTILDFSFTHCPFVCPGMTAAMLGLQSDLAGTRVRFASISVDPERDTPAVLRAHADKLGADTSRWTWMTGDIETVKRIASESLKFEIQEDPSRRIDLPDGSSMSNVMHPSRLFLIGPDRRLVAMYAFNDPDALAALRARATSAAAMLGQN